MQPLDSMPRYYISMRTVNSGMYCMHANTVSFFSQLHSDGGCQSTSVQFKLFTVMVPVELSKVCECLT